MNQTLQAGAILLIQTAASSSRPTSIGSAQLVSTGLVSGFVIFQETASGQEAMVPLESRNNSFILAFDNTDGLQTGVAVANLAAQAANVTVTLRDDSGNQLGSTATIILPAKGHTSFMLSDSTAGYPVTANLRGTMELDPPSGGQISVVGIRFTPGGAIATIPAVAK